MYEFRFTCWLFDSHALVVLQSGLGLESRLKFIFAGLGLGLGLETAVLGLGLETAGLELGLETDGLGLGLGLGKICNQVHFQFSLGSFAVFCLGRMTFCQPVSCTQAKIFVTYLIFTAELTRVLACSYYCSTRTYCN